MLPVLDVRQAQEACYAAHAIRLLAYTRIQRPRPNMEGFGNWVNMRACDCWHIRIPRLGCDGAHFI